METAEDETRTSWLDRGGRVAVVPLPARGVVAGGRYRGGVGEPCQPGCRPPDTEDGPIRPRRRGRNSSRVRWRMWQRGVCAWSGTLPHPVNTPKRKPGVPGESGQLERRWYRGTWNALAWLPTLPAPRRTTIRFLVTQNRSTARRNGQAKNRFLEPLVPGRDGAGGHRSAAWYPAGLAVRDRSVFRASWRNTGVPLTESQRPARQKASRPHLPVPGQPCPPRRL